LLSIVAALKSRSFGKSQANISPRVISTSGERRQ
jgi:hypothetical protein